MMRKLLTRKPNGQSLPEFLIAIPVFIFLILLIFQVILIYRAKTTLDYAALEAARAGSLHGADIEAIENGLIRGLTPLYATEANVSGTAEAWLKAKADVTLNAKLQIVSPTQEALAAFREPQHNGRYALPNDNLAYRPRVPDDTARVNVQDANLLKIKVDYSYPLIIPFVDLVLRGESNYTSGGADTNMNPPGLGRYFRIPLQSHAVIRMQSPIYEEGNDLPKLADLDT